MCRILATSYIFLGSSLPHSADVIKVSLKIHETVAECMILANHWVAKKIAKTFPHCALLRRHPPPKRDNFEELTRCAASKGWRVDTFSNRFVL